MFILKNLSTTNNFGLDIGDRSLRVLQLHHNKKPLELSAYGEMTIPEGIIEQGEIKDSKKLSQSIKQLINSTKLNHIKIPYCLTCLPETRTFVKVIKINNDPAIKLEDAILKAIPENLPVPLTEFYWDWQIINQDETISEVIIGVCPQNIVDDYIMALKDAGLAPIRLTIEALSIAQTLSSDFNPEGTTLIIDISATRSSLILWRQGIVYGTFNIPFSGEQLTEAIAQELHLDIKQAETEKIKQELDNPQETKITTTSPIFLELLNQVKIIIDYQSSQSTQPVNHILLSGGGGNVKNLDTYLTNQLSLPVSKHQSWEILKKLNPQIKIPAELLESTSYTTALGLALEGLEIKK